MIRLPGPEVFGGSLELELEAFCSGDEFVLVLVVSLDIVGVAWLDELLFSGDIVTPDGSIEVAV